MNKKFTKITDLPALLVFAVFAVCILTVLLFGARVYRDLAQQGEESFGQRTAAQYVRMRVRQAQTVGVGDFEGCPALELRERIGEEWYLTRVYCHEGYLRELLCIEKAAVSPGDGEKILKAEQLQLSLEGDLLIATVDGKEVVLQLRGKEAGSP